MFQFKGHENDFSLIAIQYTNPSTKYLSAFDIEIG